MPGFWDKDGAFEIAAGKGIFFSIRVVDSDVAGNVDLTGRFISFTFDDSDSKADKFTLELNNYDLLLLDDPRFAKGQKIELSWGYYDAMTPPRTMKITKANGWTKFKVEGVALSSELDKTPIQKKWTGKKYSEIAYEIAVTEGFDGPMIHVDETQAVIEYVPQFETNARFLARIAKKVGFQFYVDHTGFHFHRRRFGAPPIRAYSWGFAVAGSPPGGGIIGEPKFEVEHTRRKPGRVRVVGRDEKTGEEFDVVASNEETEREGLGKSQEVGNPETAEEGTPQSRIANERVIFTAARNKDEAKAQADSYYFQRSTDRVKLKFDAVGDPTVGAKNVIAFWCAATYPSGPYYVSSVKTTIQGKFVQGIECIRDASKKVPLEIGLPEIPLPLTVIEEGEEESFETVKDPKDIAGISSKAVVNEEELYDDSQGLPVAIEEEAPDGSWREAWQYETDLPMNGKLTVSQTAGNDVSEFFRESLQEALTYGQ